MQKNRPKRLRKNLSVRTGVMATQERQQHNDGVKVEVIDRDSKGNALIKRHCAVSDCVLASYFRREYLDAHEYEAGMRFRKAYLRAVFHIKVEDANNGAYYDQEIAFLAVPISEQILRDAYSVLSAAQKKVIINVCGHDEWAGNKDYLKTLRRGLEALARHWKLV